MAELKTPEEMDAAADLAGTELNDLVAKYRKEFNTTPNLVDIQSWYKRWYLEAGHKRLGRIIVNIKVQ